MLCPRQTLLSGALLVAGGWLLGCQGALGLDGYDFDGDDGDSASQTSASSVTTGSGAGGGSCGTVSGGELLLTGSDTALLPETDVTLQSLCVKDSAQLIACGPTAGILIGGTGSATIGGAGLVPTSAGLDFSIQGLVQPIFVLVDLTDSDAHVTVSGASATVTSFGPGALRVSGSANFLVIAAEGQAVLGDITANTIEVGANDGVVVDGMVLGTQTRGAPGPLAAPDCP